MPEISFTSSPTLTGASAKSNTCSGLSADLLPPFLHNTEPLEPEDLPLQVALLTMEVAELRQKLASLSRLFAEMARLMTPLSFMAFDEDNPETRDLNHAPG